MNPADGVPFTKEELEEAHRALSSMLHKCEKAQGKLTQGTWQWTLMKNSVRAVQVALSLITKSSERDDFSRENLEEAHQVLSSTLHKCEKAQEKLTQGTSQWTLTKNRIRALQVALSFITQALEDRA